MGTTTAVFGLWKPAGTDNVDVTTDISNNMDLIDSLIPPKASPTFTGTVGIGAAPTAVEILGVNVGVAHPGTAVTLHGLNVGPVFPATTLTAGHAVVGSLRTAASAFTMVVGSAFRADPPVLGAGSAVTALVGFYGGNMGVAGVANAYGLYSEAQSGASGNNVGCVLNGGTTANLWLNSNTATAAGGITLGTARDTNIWRANAAVVGMQGLILSGDLTASTVKTTAATLNVGTVGANTLALFTSNVNRVTISSAGLVTFADGINMAFNATTGTQIGTAITQKLAFYGGAPIVQRASADQADISNAAATNVAPWGFGSSAQANGVVILLREIRAALVALNLIKGAA